MRSGRGNKNGTSEEDPMDDRFSGLLSLIKIKTQLRECLNLLESLKWVIDGSTLDFFVEDYWSRLPKSWRETMRSLSTQELASWLSPDSSLLQSSRVFPLSLMALKASVKGLSLPRSPLSYESSREEENIKDPLFHLFRKNVNPKKRHELPIFSKFVQKVANLSGVKGVVDFGSGLGHLARRLYFKHEFSPVIAIDNQEFLSLRAREMDRAFSLKRPMDTPLPLHITQFITPHTLLKDFSPPVGFVGLHACGDLSSIIIKLFTENISSRFLCLVTCCYMKDSLGFLSSFLEDQTLSYYARELGCHALEFYVEKLRSSDSEKLLKVHCYRALLERILSDIHPKYRHKSLKTVSNAHNMNFKDYANSATSTLDVVLPENAIEEAEIDLMKYWWDVATFYVLRLSLAPVIETIVLLDRCLYLLEKGFKTSITPLFEPRISPRNFAILSTKNQ